MEYLYSDEGQLKWLEGYCHPIRFDALAKAGTIPQELLDKLPPAAAYEAAVFPTLEEQEAMTDVDQGRLGQDRRRQRPVDRRGPRRSAGARAHQEPRMAAISPATRPFLGLARHPAVPRSSRCCS